MSSASEYAIKILKMPLVDTLYGQKVLLLKLKQLLQDDLVAHPRTFAVISHFFPLTSSVFFPMVLR